ncbi:MAG: hypothetical protein R6U96_02520 [Promethearchaeia archaeon]
MTTFWAPLIHIYQPPTQDIKILKKINEECYKPLFKVIESHKNAKFSLNINGVLIEMLYEYGMGDTMDLLKDLVAENKVEILGTAKFHPILPLIPKKEAYHQIRMNEDVNRKEFGNIWERNGFFPPELAISSKVAKYIRKHNYKWVIMSGIACPVDWPYDKIYKSPNGLQLFFRDDILSNKISFKKITAKEFVQELREHYKDKKYEYKNDTYTITAMDGETFGHHIPNYEKKFLGKALDLIAENGDFNNQEENGKEGDGKKRTDDIKIVFISELDHYFPISDKRIIPRESSWSTNLEDIRKGIPYPLWKHPDNDVHKYYWKVIKSLNKLMELADNLDLTKEWEVENYYNTARWYYDRGLHSCPTWWANPLNDTWSPNLIYKGIDLLMRAALNAELALEYAGIEDGEGYFDSISFYESLLLMELYETTRKNLKKK